MTKRVKEKCYIGVPYAFLKKNKEGVFATRFRLYKKKECERRRRYKNNKIKDEAYLNHLRKKHRCSYCRGLYWSVFYYRGFMMCKYCYTKKDVMEYVLFGDRVDEELLGDGCKKIKNRQYSQNAYDNHLDAYDYDECDENDVCEILTEMKKKISDLDAPSLCPPCDGCNECIPPITTPSDGSYIDIIPHYDKEYWRYTGLSLFL